MARTTITYTISLPPALAIKLEGVMEKEYRTRSELIREALRQYLEREKAKHNPPTPTSLGQTIR